MKRIAKFVSSLLVLNSYSCDDRKIPVCKESEISEGNIKEIYIGNKKYLLCKVSGVVYCINSKCPHQGASLYGGFLNGYNIVCPMHGAEFDIRTGDIKNYPGFKPLSTYKVIAENGRISINLIKSEGLLYKNIQEDHRHFIIIGAGAAGIAAAETLRKEGFSGKITIISNENYLPYDRVLLSKNILLDKNDVELASESYFINNKIDIIKNTSVVSISKNFITTSDGKALNYDSLLLATGASPKIPLSFQDYASISNFFTLRNFDDYLKLKEKIQSSERICIIGNRFLGLECATSIKKTYPEKNISFIEYEPFALGKVIGPLLYYHMFESLKNNGINTIFSTTFERFEVNNDKIVSVVLNDQKIDTDMILLSVGSSIFTPYAPIELKNSDSSIKVNEYLQTNYENVFAAGDIADFPSIHTNNRERIEH